MTFKLREQNTQRGITRQPIVMGTLLEVLVLWVLRTSVLAVREYIYQIHTNANVQLWKPHQTVTFPVFSLTEFSEQSVPAFILLLFLSVFNKPMDSSLWSSVQTCWDHRGLHCASRSNRARQETEAVSGRRAHRPVPAERGVHERAAAQPRVPHCLRERY